MTSSLEAPPHVAIDDLGSPEAFMEAVDGGSPMQVVSTHTCPRVRAHVLSTPDRPVRADLTPPAPEPVP